MPPPAWGHEQAARHRRRRRSGGGAVDRALTSDSELPMASSGCWPLGLLAAPTAGCPGCTRATRCYSLVLEAQGREALGAQRAAIKAGAPELDVA